MYGLADLLPIIDHKDISKKLIMVLPDAIFPTEVNPANVKQLASDVTDAYDYFRARLSAYSARIENIWSEMKRKKHSDLLDVVGPGILCVHRPDLDGWKLIELHSNDEPKRVSTPYTEQDRESDKVIREFIKGVDEIPGSDSPPTWQPVLKYTFPLRR
ncbi:hypothetical protein BKA67DRAFT_538974 [Truncatella angustata]|uniref:Uncharacterized protein n=1 Tax=Truncatella angustata TaxID=152316 RepID=A0A9P8ZVJ3_9PEZI|nr:uncharacterized protein BKA67DRAFT_538974 [Truncatella angustata]KAH6648968.1 hypothetical protein BKA67DRAFT_538974 [Truncatella angustata]